LVACRAAVAVDHCYALDLVVLVVILLVPPVNQVLLCLLEVANRLSSFTRYVYIRQVLP